MHASIYFVIAGLCQRFVPEKGWNSGYIRVAIVGGTQVKYSCTIGWAAFMYCYISLEVFMPGMAATVTSYLLHFDYQGN